MGKLCKIVVTGPESTAKSWLCERLADHFSAPWADEYARLYFEKHGSDYDFATLEQMAQEHLRHQQIATSSAKDRIFLDTDLINYLIWERLVFGKVHPFIEENIEEEKNHRYLLAYPDIPWTPDPFRENPENRMELFDLHLQEIEKRKRPYRIVRGSGKARLKNGIKATKELLSLEP